MVRIMNGCTIRKKFILLIDTNCIQLKNFIKKLLHILCSHTLISLVLFLDLNTKLYN